MIDRDPLRELDQQAAFEEAERTRAEKRANAGFDSFIDASPVAIELYDRDGGLLRSNKAAERLLGKVPPPGISLFDERGLKRAGMLEPQLKRVLAGTRVETPPTWYDPTEIGLPGVPGRKVCFRATVFPVFDEEGDVVRIAVMHEDITEQKNLETELKEAHTGGTAPAPERPLSDDVRDVEFRRRKIEQALRETEERFNALVREADGFVVVRTTDEGRILAVSPSIEGIWGMSAGAIQTDPSAFLGQIHADDIDRVRQVERAARERNGSVEHIRFRVRNRQTDRLHWVEAGGSAGATGGKRVLDLVLFEVTGRVEVDESLAALQADFDRLAASPVDGSASVDRDLVVTGWGKGAERETRISASDAVGKPLAEACPDLGAGGFADACRRALASRDVATHEAATDGPDAARYRLAAHPVGTGLLLFIRNTTEQRRLEQSWRDAEARFRALVDAPGVAVLIKDTGLRYTHANPAAVGMLGLKVERDIVGKTDADILKPSVADLIGSHDRQVLDEGTPVEFELALPDLVSTGAGWHRVVKCPLRSQSGAVVGILDVAYDVTDRVRARQELVRRQTYLGKLIKKQAAALKQLERELERWSKQ